jgi:hypothetical protein
MIAYTLKSGIILLMMYGAYAFLLKREKLFTFNRFFLISSIVIALIIPLLYVPVTFTLPSKVNDVFTGYTNLISSPVATDKTAETILTGNSIPGGNSLRRDFKLVIIGIYSLISTFLLIRFIRNIYLIRRKIRSSQKITHEGYKLVLTDEKSVPCCFNKTIFLNREDYNTGSIDPELIRHELEHARQSHTIDILFIELIKIIFWFNPLFILYNKAIRINHEYLADKGVIHHKYDISAYAHKLLACVSTGNSIPLTSSSDYSFTKNRIIMLTKPNPSRSSSGIRILMAMSLMLLISVITVSFRNPDREVKGFVLNKYGKYLAGVDIRVKGQKDKIRTDDMGHFILRNAPENAELTFSAKDYASKTVSVVFTTEMVIKLIPDISTDELKKRAAEFFPARGSNPLIVIDGVPDEKVLMTEIDPSNNVSSIKILTSSDAMQKYGDKAKSGAIEIITENEKGSTKSPAYDSPEFKAKTLVLVDGKVYSGNINDIPVDKIGSMSVLNYKSSYDKFGEKGKEKVIEITTK